MTQLIFLCKLKMAGHRLIYKEAVGMSNSQQMLSFKAAPIRQYTTWFH